MKKAYVKSYGCQMNAYDAGRMSDLLGSQGYAATESVEEADVVILNTCHIREKAADKVYSEPRPTARSEIGSCRGWAGHTDRGRGLRRTG